MLKLQYVYPKPWVFKRKPKGLANFHLFTSSSAVLERITAWSGSNRRERLFVMNFHEIWRHDQCPVHGWYEQQDRSSTRFQSIEHRQDINGPFFHEFLLLKLTDSAICRVERTGDGSRADAIWYTGCTANDVIQWFSKEDYEIFEAKHPSVLLANVELGREFDIQDVLAVCYSIQRTPACGVHTLQRYNCYFMCWTILAVLTRRVARWETAIETSKWDSSIARAFGHLSERSTEEWRRYLILRVCELLCPKDLNPSKLVARVLTDSLSVGAGTLTHLNKALRGTLWQSSWEVAFRDGLSDALANTVGDLLNSFVSRRLRESEPTNWIEPNIPWRRVLKVNVKYQTLLDRAERGCLSIEQTMAELETAGILDYPGELLVAGDWLSHPHLSDSLLLYAGRALSEALKTVLQDQQVHMAMRSVDKGGFSPADESMLAVQLQQQYIQSRIRAHAKRVAAPQPGTEPALYNDIGDTMTKVWRGMPGGFGGTDQGVANTVPHRRATIGDIIYP